MKSFQKILSFLFVMLIVTACSAVTEYEKLESLPNGIYTSVTKSTITINKTALTLNDPEESSIPINYTILDLAFYKDLSTDQEYTLSFQESAETLNAKVIVSYGYSAEEMPQEIIIVFKGKGYGLAF